MSNDLICVEWGTAQLRARRISRDGCVRDTHVESVRLADIDRSHIVGRIEALRSRWPDVSTPILLSGMIGSAMGWCDVPRVDCPASPAAIAAAAVRTAVGGADAVFLPGLACTSRFGDPDVLRGEEVPAVGALSRSGGKAGLILSVPGMHGKWLVHDGARIVQFHTAMTVELYHALADRSVLAPMMSGPVRLAAAFGAGVASGAGGGGLARLLFAARSRAQSGQLASDDTASYLWGVLIGADVRENLPLLAGGRCLVLGAAEVAPLFAAAIRQLGGDAELGIGDEISALGFLNLAALLHEEGTMA